MSGGLEKIAEGREAELFLRPDGRVLRLARAEHPFAEQAIRLEAIALAAAAEAGVPVPALYERVTHEGRHGLVIERLEGLDLLSLLGRRPWLLPSVARQTGRLHAELHRTDGPATLPALGDLVRARIEISDAVPADLREETLRALAELPAGDRLCHGDFHPGNVIQGATGTRIVDWTTASRGDPMADLARSWVLLEVSPLPPGASRLVRALTPLGRGVLLRGYTRAYAREASVDSELLRRWIRVLATERLAEEVPGEREALLTRLESGNNVT